MEGQVAFRAKKERYDRLMQVQQRISREINEGWVGRELRVLFEDVRDGWSIGRSHRDAPEIDGQVFRKGVTEPGTYADVTIEEADVYDLIGQAVAGSAEVERVVEHRIPKKPQ
jgi:ribosomal protein S12 methylthiotransferase